MISLTRSEIPNYLRESALFASLNEEDDDLISIPKEHCKLDFTIDSNEDIIHSLNTIRFWGVSRVPDYLISLALSNKGAFLFGQMEEFGRELNYLHLLVNIHILSPKEKLKAAVQNEWFEVVEDLYCQNVFVPKDICEIAIMCGNSASLVYFHQRGYALPAKGCLFAARSGDVCCLKYAHDQGCQWDGGKVCDIAAEWGHTACLAYALQHCNETSGGRSIACARASTNGHLSCLVLLHPHVHTRNLEACCNAVANGHLDCLTFLHEHGWPWTADTYHPAIENNHMHCFIYLHEQGCPWDASVALKCAESNALVFLQYAVEHGCPLTAQVLARAAVRGHLACIVYLREHNCPHNAGVCAAAVSHFACLQYLHERGCPWNSHTINAAVIAGSFESLHYATERGCAWYDEGDAFHCACHSLYACTSPLVETYVNSKGCPCPEWRRERREAHRRMNQEKKNRKSGK